VLKKNNKLIIYFDYISIMFRFIIFVMFLEDNYKSKEI